MAGVRASEHNRPHRMPQERVDFILAKSKEGLSAGEIAKILKGHTRNSIIGIIARHADRPGTERRFTPANTAGSAMFAEPTPPRRFSFQDLPAE